MKKIVLLTALIAHVSGAQPYREQLGEKLRQTCLYWSYQHAMGRLDQFMGFCGQQKEHIKNAVFGKKIGFSDISFSIKRQTYPIELVYGELRAVDQGYLYDDTIKCALTIDKDNKIKCVDCARYVDNKFSDVYFDLYRFKKYVFGKDTQDIYQSIKDQVGKDNPDAAIYWAWAIKNAQSNYAQSVVINK